MLKIIIVASVTAAPFLFSASAHAACKNGEVLRTNTQGQPQCVNGKRTFQDCVYGGMQLGYSNEAAQRYCQSKRSSK
jgi:hypothetical protein